MKIKALLAMSIASVGLMNSAAYAVSDMVDVTANMPFTCVIATDAADMTLTALDADGDVIVDAGVEATATWGDSYCNGAHEIQIDSANDGMTQSGAVQPTGSDAFDLSINYTATISEWGAAPSFTTDGTATNSTAEADVATAFRNDGITTGTPRETAGLTLTVATVAGSNPLLEGDYTDTITVFIQVAD